MNSLPIKFILLSVAVFLSPACDSLNPSKNKGAIKTPEELLNDKDNNNVEKASSKRNSGYSLRDGEKFIRTGPQYVYAVAKTLNFRGSEVREWSNFESNKPKFASETELDAENIDFLPYIHMAAVVCTRYVNHDSNKDKSFADIISEISSKVYVNTEEAAIAVSEVQSLTESLEGEDQKQVACAYLTAGNILY